MRSSATGYRGAQLGVPMWPITIATSAMGEARRDPVGDAWTVPKRDPIGALQVLAFSVRLKIASDLRQARTLATVLEQFRMNITQSANVTYESWRGRDHNDLVLATAMACWASFRWCVGPGWI